MTLWVQTVQSLDTVRPVGATIYVYLINCPKMKMFTNKAIPHEDKASPLKREAPPFTFETIEQRYIVKFAQDRVNRRGRWFTSVYGLRGVFKGFTGGYMCYDNRGVNNMLSACHSKSWYRLTSFAQTDQKLEHLHEFLIFDKIFRARLCLAHSPLKTAQACSLNNVYTVRKNKYHIKR